MEHKNIHFDLDGTLSIVSVRPPHLSFRLPKRFDPSFPRWRRGNEREGGGVAWAFGGVAGE